MAFYRRFFGAFYGAQRSCAQWQGFTVLPVTARSPGLKPGGWQRSDQGFYFQS